MGQLYKYIFCLCPWLSEQMGVGGASHRLLTVNFPPAWMKWSNQFCHMRFFFFNFSKAQFCSDKMLLLFTADVWMQCTSSLTQPCRFWTIIVNLSCNWKALVQNIRSTTCFTISDGMQLCKKNGEKKQYNWKMWPYLKKLQAIRTKIEIHWSQKIICL